MSEAEELLDLTTIQPFSHDHTLELIEKKKNGSEEVECSRCGNQIEGLTYCCTKCKFYLHKTCTNLPLNISHPLHQEHTLKLHLKSPYSRGLPPCDLCSDKEGFFYHCSSCKFDLDVKCALSPQLIAGDFSKLQHFSHAHPLILIQRHNNILKKVSCAACEEPTSPPLYCCIDCKIYLHERCAELPPELTHPSHSIHPLVLLANPPPYQGRCSCYLCKNPCKGFYYHCSFCEFGIKIKHIVSSKSENGNHEHPFILLSKPMLFICDACGTDGDCIPYICTTCNLAVHKECISLPNIIKAPRHIHLLSHIYFLSQKEYKQRDCKICHNEVKPEYGSYCCSDCDYIAHVNCSRELGWLTSKEGTYFWSEETMGLVPYPDDSKNSAQDVTATEIKHFSHKHTLMLCEEMIDATYCDGCMVTISGPFYFCKQCKFFLHKSCAKLPMKTRFWFSWDKFWLQEYSIFKCPVCNFWSSGFSYKSERKRTVCLRCCATPDFFTYEGHEHTIFFDNKYNGNCTACGHKIYGCYRCKNNDYALGYGCISLPQTTQHKNHKHPLKLTYKDGVDPSQYYCDICEEERDPAYWFYSCADCNFAAHRKCTLGQHPFIQEDVTATFNCHPHLLVTVRKVYYYPPCKECHKPCLNLALECTEPECNYIIHWDCLRDSFPILDCGKMPSVAV